MIATNEFFKTDGARLEVKIINYSNNNKLSSIVLLHEGLGSVSMWKEWPQELSEKLKRNVIVYSRLGMGYSSPLKKPRNISFMHEESKKYLKKIIENYCVIEPILYGHSDGASISIIYAGLGFPLNSIILEAPHLLVEDITIDEIKKLRSLWDKSNIKKRFGKYHNDAESAFIEWCKIWLSRDFRNWNIVNYANSIRVPVLAIQGANDQYGTMKQIDLLEKNVKTKFSKFILESCKHSPHKEYPELILEKIDSFLLNN